MSYPISIIFERRQFRLESTETGLNTLQAGVFPVIISGRGQIRLESIETGLNTPQAGVSPVIISRTEQLT